MNYRRYTKEQLERTLYQNEDTYRGYIKCYLTEKDSIQREYLMNALESTALEFCLITANLFGKRFAEGIDKISEDPMNSLESHRLCSSFKGEENHGS